MSLGMKILMMVKSSTDDPDTCEESPASASSPTNNILIRPDDELFDILNNYLDSGGGNVGVENIETSTVISEVPYTTKQVEDKSSYEDVSGKDLQDADMSQENIDEECTSRDINLNRLEVADPEEVIRSSNGIAKDDDNTCEKYFEETTMENEDDNFSKTNEDISDNYDNVQSADNDLDKNDQIENSDPDRKTSQAETRRKRVLGLPYMGYKRLNKKIYNNIPKPGRMLVERCTHKILVKHTFRSFRCATFTEEDRKLAHNNFWKIPSWKEKQAFVKGLVTTRDVRRRRKVLEERCHDVRKNEGHDIYLQVMNGDKLRVCRKFFLNTLGLGEDTFKRWVKKIASPDQHFESQKMEIEKNHNSENQETIEVGSRKQVRENVKLWLQQLPKVPSHYCRASSNKVYVDSTFRSKLHMFSVYKDWCVANEMRQAGRILFTKILDDEKIAIHMPRKDQCDVCCGFKVGTVDQDEYEKHIKNKNDAREAKNAAKLKASPEKMVLTMDLQSVLLCPLLLASQVYYKQKLQVHNFTLYELNNGNVTLYVWHEGNGGVSSNEFTSCIVDFISTIPNNVKEITLISDGCNYQNRNKVLASSLSNLAKRKAITIEQMYLEKGHTMMEADSVHATLEKYFKPPINSPADYIALMRMARPSNPYNVKVLDYTFFLNFEKSTDLPSIRPGKKPGDPQVVDIRALLYKPDGSILYKMHHTDEYIDLPQRRKSNIDNKLDMVALYRNPVPINESKYKHLQEMKAIIEEPHRAFYDSLVFKPDKKN